MGEIKLKTFRKQSERRTTVFRYKYIERERKREKERAEKERGRLLRKGLYVVCSCIQHFRVADGNDNDVDVVVGVGVSVGVLSCSAISFD